MKRRTLIALGIGFAMWHSPSAAQDRYWIVTGQDAALSTIQSLMASPQAAGAPSGFRILSSQSGRSVVEIDESIFDEVHTVLHAKFKRCGGYTIYSSREAAVAEMQNPLYNVDVLGQKLAFPRQIDQQEFVRPALDMVNREQIVSVIQELEQFGTRYFQNQKGQDAATFVRQLWAGFRANRPDLTVELVEHGGWKQDSVIATLKGVELSDEIVMIGAHLDSINVGNREDAPGADDDASGIAVVSEVLRVILETGVRPKRTMQFIAYAAEEVGLRGSREIAEDYKDEGKTVVAALQMDMTGFQGSQMDMYFINDYVSTELTGFMKELIGEYNGSGGAHQIRYGDTQCGYGCSDHVSWTRIGVPAAFPFEAAFADYNPAIHSAQDTLRNGDQTGVHQARFAKLGIEFMMEIAKISGEAPSPGKDRYLYTTLRVITNGSPRGCGYANWSCMTNLCKSDLQDAAAWRGWAGCWRQDDNYQCYFECGQVKRAS